jgi:hypothetical protein
MKACQFYYYFHTVHGRVDVTPTNLFLQREICIRPEVFDLSIILK